MAAVVIDRAEIRLSLPQILSILKQLSPVERAVIKTALEMDDDTWREQFARVLAAIRADVAQDPNPITEEEITAEVEAVRAKNYAEGRH